MISGLLVTLMKRGSIITDEIIMEYIEHQEVTIEDKDFMVSD